MLFRRLFAIFNSNFKKPSLDCLSLAAQKGHDDVATILIAAGADLELKAEFWINSQKSNSTALQMAIEKERTEVVASLVAAGANVEVKDLFEALPRYNREAADILRGAIKWKFS